MGVVCPLQKIGGKISIAHRYMDMPIRELLILDGPVCGVIV